MSETTLINSGVIGLGNTAHLFRLTSTGDSYRVYWDRNGIVHLLLATHDLSEANQHYDFNVKEFRTAAAAE